MTKEYTTYATHSTPGEDTNTGIVGDEHVRPAVDHTSPGVHADNVASQSNHAVPTSHSASSEGDANAEAHQTQAHPGHYNPEPTDSHHSHTSPSDDHSHHSHDHSHHSHDHSHDHPGHHAHDDTKSYGVLAGPQLHHGASHHDGAQVQSYEAPVSGGQVEKGC